MADDTSGLTCWHFWRYRTTLRGWWTGSPSSVRYRIEDADKKCCGDCALRAIPKEARRG